MEKTRQKFFLKLPLHVGDQPGLTGTLGVGGFMDGFVDKYPNQVQVGQLVLMPGYQ